MRFLLPLIFWMISTGAAAALLVGVSAPRGGMGEQRWQALAPYFSAALVTPLDIVGFPPNRIGPEMASGRLSFALVNPVTAVEMIQRNHAIPIATLKARGTIHFAGAIIVRHDSPIHSVADVRGKDVLAYQAKSAGAYVFQLYHLLKHGVPASSLKSLRHSNNQEEIVLAVVAGKIDVGFVRSGMIEVLAAENRIDPAQIRVLDQRQDELQPKHTTDLYPEWILMASPRMSAEVIDRFRRAALALRPDSPTAQAAQIDGFVPPLDLDAVRQALQALRLPPFEGPALR